MLMKQVKGKSIGPTPEQAPGTWKMVHKMKMAMISTNDVSSTSAIMTLCQTHTHTHTFLLQQLA